MREGRFREDLFYRVNVVSIAVPPLRERQADIAWLLDQFFDQFNAEGELAGVSGLAEEASLRHAWPGNVRELRNRVERGVALALGPWLMPGDLFPESAGMRLDHSAALPSLEDARLAAERRHILRALALTGGEIIPAAKALGISRTTLVGEDAPPRHRQPGRSEPVRKSEHRPARGSGIRTSALGASPDRGMLLRGVDSHHQLGWSARPRLAGGLTPRVGTGNLGRLPPLRLPRGRA